MEIIVYKAEDRGHANHDWLDTYHSFSFASYYNPDLIGFGALRVINDDAIAAGKGFGKHPHENMEIITIPLSWALKHQDNIGGWGIIWSNDVQVMSAGTGIIHSEFNASDTEEVRLFQIWIEPSQWGATPRYDQKTFPESGRVNQFQLLVSPDGREGSLMIHQNAFISRVVLDAGTSLEYELIDETNVVYVMVVEWSGSIESQDLGRRDALSVIGIPSISLQATSDLDLLILEIPM